MWIPRDPPEQQAPANLREFQDVNNVEGGWGREHVLVIRIQGQFHHFVIWLSMAILNAWILLGFSGAIREETFFTFLEPLMYVLVIITSIRVYNEGANRAQDNELCFIDIVLIQLCFLYLFMSLLVLFEAIKEDSIRFLESTASTILGAAFSSFMFGVALEFLGIDPE